jgi:RNA polymerase sigma-70 factor (ECF subfamily)
MRRRHVKLESIEEGALDVYAVSPEQEKKLEFQELRVALAKLSREHREVLLLVGASGFQYEEAAKICKCAVGTIKSRLSRARNELYQLLLGVAANEEKSASEADRPRRISDAMAILLAS